MDGHEQADVVDYRKKMFLPTVNQYEKLMAKHVLDEQTGELKNIMPELEEGQRVEICTGED